MKRLLPLLVSGVLGCGLFSGAEEQPESLKATQVAAQRVEVAGGMVSPLMASPGWSSTGSMAMTRTGHTATLLPSGKVLVTGGSAFSDLLSSSTYIDSLSSAEVYDPATGTWSPTGSMARRRAQHTATLLPSGKVLVTGGSERSNLLLGPNDTYGDGLSSAEVYDPATGTWSPAGYMNSSRSYHTATLLPSGRVLVAGGISGFFEQDSADVYDPVTGTWSPTGTMATSHFSHTATLLPSGKVLVTGGEGFKPCVEVYDPATGTWSPADSLATSRYRHTATLLPSGKVLVTGGQGAGRLFGFDSAEVHDPAPGAWSPTGSLARDRYFHTATLLPSGKVLITGGQGAGFGPDSVEVYDPATGAWSPMGPLVRYRYFHTATLLPSGNVLVTGGRGSTGPLTSAEVYSTLRVVAPAYDSATSDSTPTYSGIGEADNAVTLIVDGSPVGDPLANAAGHWSFTPVTALSDGLHTVRATATNASGNTRAESSPVPFMVDTTPPAAPEVMAPANGSTTRHDTPTSGTAEAGSTITLIVDDSPVGNATADTAGNWSITPTTVLADGTHTMRATATDAAGNTSASSSANTFRMDATPPAAPVVQVPADNSSLGDNTPTFSGIAEAGSTVTLIVDGSSVGNSTTDAAGHWSFTFTTALPDGQRRVWMTATDGVGNISRASDIQRFAVDTVPPNAPQLSLPETINTQKPIIAGIAETHGTITIWLDGVMAGTAVASATGLWVFSPDTELAEGVHQVKATASDAVGNTSSYSEERSFTIVIIKKGYYGWNCATAPAVPATWALLTLALLSVGAGAGLLDCSKRGKSPGDRRRLVNPLLRLGLLAGLLAASVAGAEKRIAVLVFDSKGWTGDSLLKHSSDDVGRLEETLKLVGNFAPKDIHVLSRPTTEQLLQQLKTLADNSREISDKTFFLFYYSGHADQTHLHIPGAPLSYEDLKEQLKAFPAALKVGILDACQSGGIIDKGGKPAPSFEVKVTDSLHMQGMVLLTSSGADELSQEHRTLAGSIFSHHLISGLRGAADENADHRVSLDEAYRHAYERTWVDTLSTPVGEQKPRLKVDVSGQGSIILSWLEQVSPTLHLPSGDWRCYVTDRLERKLIVEALLEPTHKLHMALVPGHYVLKCLTSQKRLLLARFSIAPGERVDAAQLGFEVVPPEDADILQKGWQVSPPWRWVVGLRGEAELLKGGLTPALSLSATRQVDSSLSLMEFGGAVTAIVQPTPGLRLEACLYPYSWHFAAASRASLRVSLGATTFFPAVPLGGRLGVGMGVRAGRLHVSGEIAYERFLELEKTHEPNALLFSLGVGWEPFAASR